MECTCICSSADLSVGVLSSHLLKLGFGSVEEAETSHNLEKEERITKSAMNIDLHRNVDETVKGRIVWDRRDLCVMFLCDDDAWPLTDVRFELHGTQEVVMQSMIDWLERPETREYVRDPWKMIVTNIRDCASLLRLMGCLGQIRGTCTHLRHVVLTGWYSEGVKVPVLVLSMFLDAICEGDVSNLETIACRGIEWSGGDDDFEVAAKSVRKHLCLTEFSVQLPTRDMAWRWFSVVIRLLSLPNIKAIVFADQLLPDRPPFKSCYACIRGDSVQRLMKKIQHNKTMTDFHIAPLFSVSLHEWGPSEGSSSGKISSLAMSVTEIRMSVGRLVQLLGWGACLELEVDERDAVMASQYVAESIRFHCCKHVRIHFIGKDRHPQAKSCISRQWEDVIAVNVDIERVKLTIGNRKQRYPGERLGTVGMEFLLRWNRDQRGCVLKDLDRYSDSPTTWIHRLQLCSRTEEDEPTKLSRLFWFVQEYLVHSPMIARACPRASEDRGLPTAVATALPVFYRTYSRRKENRQQETWNEVVDRVLAGLERVGRFSRRESSLIETSVKKLHALPSGRYLWVGGTEWHAKKENVLGVYNCASLMAASPGGGWESFPLAMDLAMQGCGVGVVLEEVQCLPIIVNRLHVLVSGEKLWTQDMMGKLEYTHVKILSNGRVFLRVGDSREGWIGAYDILLNLSSCRTGLELMNAAGKTARIHWEYAMDCHEVQFSTGEDTFIQVEVDVRFVRPAGTALKGFGGTANPVRLGRLFQRTSEILCFACGRRINSLEACLLLDEACLCIVAGNIRRAAGMRQFDSRDPLGVSAKAGLYVFEEGRWRVDLKREAMCVANHTRMYRHQPSVEECTEAVLHQYRTGEGAIQWCHEAEKRAGEGNIGMNPCGEILGRDFVCNLAEVHLNRLAKKDRAVQDAAFEAAALMAACLLHHKFPYERLQRSKDTDPIVGVSFTGLFDFLVLTLGVEWLKWWQKGRPQDSDEGRRFLREERLYLCHWRAVVEKTVHRYCRKNLLKCPSRCTTVQPAGTKSLLTGASPGWHPPKSTRFIKRITFQKRDPVALACMDLGYTVTPGYSDWDANGKLLDDPYDERCTEWLVEVPVEVPWATLPGADSICLEDFSAVAQFDFYMQVQKYYTGHNTSGTIELTEDEIEAMGRRIHEAIAKDEGYVSVALVARQYDGREQFPRLPYEKVSRNRYEQIIATMKKQRKVEEFCDALQQYVSLGDDDHGPDGCDSEKCMCRREIPS